MKVLCICTANLQRSVTLEALLNATPGQEARSAGTHPSQGRHRITENDLTWADVVVVFEPDHVRHLRNHFYAFWKRAKPINLDVPDEYTAFTPELIEILGERIQRRFAITLSPMEAIR